MGAVKEFLRDVVANMRVPYPFKVGYWSGNEEVGGRQSKTSGWNA